MLREERPEALALGAMMDGMRLLAKAGGRLEQESLASCRKVVSLQGLISLTYLPATASGVPPSTALFFMLPMQLRT